MASDFNRHGIAVVLDQPVARDKTIYVTLQNGSVKLENVVAVVHNCVAQEQGFRCGIQFRTASALQFDRELIEQELSILEARFKALPRAS